MVRFSVVLVGLGMSLSGCFISEQEIREEYRGCTIRQQEGGPSFVLTDDTYTPIAQPAIRGDGAGNWWVWTVSGDLGNQQVRRHELLANVEDTEPKIICPYGVPSDWQMCDDREQDVWLGRTRVDYDRQRFMLTDRPDQMSESSGDGTFMRFLDGVTGADGARIIYIETYMEDVNEDPQTHRGSLNEPVLNHQEIGIRDAPNGFSDLAAGRTAGGDCVAGLVMLENGMEALKAVFVPDSGKARDKIIADAAEIPPAPCHLSNMAQTATGWLLMCHHEADDAIAVYHTPPDCRTWTRVETDPEQVEADPRLAVGGRTEPTPVSLVPGPGGGLVGAWATKTQVAVAQFDADGAIRAIEMFTPTPGCDGHTEPQAVSLAVDGASYLVAYTMEDGCAPAFRLLECAP